MLESAAAASRDEVRTGGAWVIAEQVMSPKASNSEEMMRRRRTEGASEDAKETASSTRANGASQGAELALVPVSKERVGKKSPEGVRSEVEQTPIEALEDLPPPPKGEPQQFGPKNLQPLFDEAQLKRDQELRQQAPMLQPKVPPAQETPALTWDAAATGVGVGMGAKGKEVSPAPMVVSPFGYPLVPQPPPGYGNLPPPHHAGMPPIWFRSLGREHPMEDAPRTGPLSTSCTTNARGEP